MIVVLNGTSTALLDRVSAELVALDWPDARRPEVQTGLFDEPEPLRDLRRALAVRDPESYAIRLREEGHERTAVQDEAAARGDVGLVIEAEGREPAELAEEIAALLLEEVKLEEPRSDWQRRYVEERELIEAALGSRLDALHHIGSTVLVDVPCKPILDVLAELPSLEDFPDCLRPLAAIGYSFQDYPENVERRFLRKGRPRTHHLHVVETGSQESRDHVDFRDALLADTELRVEYADLKRGLAGRHGRARAAYGAGKSSFIARVLRRRREGRWPGPFTKG